MATALRELKVDVTVVELPPEVIRAIQQAQKRQVR